MNKQFVRYLNWVFLLAFSAILIGSYWPLPEKVQVLRINQAYLDDEQIAACPQLTALLDYDLQLAVPEKVWRSEESQIELDIYPIKKIKSPISTGSDSCNLTLEIKLDMDNLRIEPGDRIVVPFKGDFDQTFTFNITPYSTEKAEGELWISADIYGAGGKQQSHMPLFVIPLEVEVVSIFGLPPIIVRYICLFALMIQFVIAFRRRLFT